MLGALRVALEARCSSEEALSCVGCATDGDLLRALRARKNDERAAVELVIQEKIWRRENLPVNEDNEKMLKVRARNVAYIVHAPDYEGRSVVMTITARHDRSEVQFEEGEAFGLWLVEHTISHAQRFGHEQFTLIFDLAGFGWAQMDLPLARRMNELLVQSYPERLGKCLLLNAPFVFSSFYALVSPFIDQSTRERIVFVRDLAQLHEFVPREHLPTEYGGPRDLEIDVKRTYNA
uniref:CRAL-TRIO domain-containing protein n=1 Tax=Erythrolobus madagascarensis TaxID=708628 RepID=A0A7S0T589_9RHOD